MCAMLLWSIHVGLPKLSMALSGAGPLMTCSHIVVWGTQRCSLRQVPTFFANIIAVNSDTPILWHTEQGTWNRQDARGQTRQRFFWQERRPNVHQAPFLVVRRHTGSSSLWEKELGACWDACIYIASTWIVFTPHPTWMRSQSANFANSSWRPRVIGLINKRDKHPCRNIHVT